MFKNHQSKIVKIRYYTLAHSLSLKEFKHSKKQMMVLIMILLVLSTARSCPFTPSALPSALSCIKNIVCVMSAGGQQRAFLQKCNKQWYYGSSSTSMTKLGPSIPLSSSSFVKNSQLSKSIKANGQFALIEFNSTNIFFYALGSNSYTKSLTFQGQMVDYWPLTLSNSTRSAIIATAEEVITLAVDGSGNTIATNSISIGSSLSKISCLSDNKRCVLGDQNGRLFVIDVENSSVIATIETDTKERVNVLKTKQVLNQSTFKIYVVYINGILSEYRYDGKSLALQRQSSYFKNSIIHQLGSFDHSNYLIVTDTAGNATQIDLDTGILLDSVSIEPYLAVKTSLGMALLLNDPTSYFLYNTANSVIFYITVTPDSNHNQLVLSCINLFYYNNTQQECAPCSPTCATCDPLSGKCLNCINQYFNSDGSCESCYFNAQGLTDHFEECFSKNQQAVMNTSEATVKFISIVVSNFAVVLNLCGLLFLFLKLINNWNIISLYFFVQIETPFFLENVLKMIFTSLNSSVLQTVGINIEWSLYTQDRSNNDKFQIMGMSTDFLAMNAQSIILFFYSVVLTVTVYKFLNYLLAKVKISIFDQNTAISIIEQFIGCFTTSLLPFYYIISKPFFRNRAQRVNSACHYLFFGITILIPFCFLIFDYEYKYIRTNKVHNNDQNAIADSVNLGLTKRIQAWREDDSKQNFFYGLLSFSTAVLACHPDPKVFIFGVGFVNILCLLNAFSCKQRKLNVIIQKLSFLLFHCCFSSLYFLSEGRTKLKVSLFLVMLVILIAVHEILHNIYKKVYFVYILIKGKWEKEQKIRAFFQQNEQKLAKKNRAHPVALNLKPNSEANVGSQVKFKFNQFEIRFVKEPQDDNSQLHTQKSNKKKDLKTNKKIKDQAIRGKEVTFQTERGPDNTRRPISSRKKKKQ